MPRHVIVGDVHGMLDALKAMLARVDLRREDILVLVGDIVDRGPDSPGTVRFLRKLAGKQPVVLVKGNHEAKHARWRRRLAVDQAAAMKLRDAKEYAEITAAMSVKDVVWLDDSPLWLRIPEHRALVVHGGIPPLMPRLAGDGRAGAGDGFGGDARLAGPVALAELPGADRPWAEQMLRMRWVRGETSADLIVDATVDLAAGEAPPAVGDEVAVSGRVVRRKVRPRGEFLPLGAQAPGDPYWADLYDGRWGHVYFGHNPFAEFTAPRRFPHATALDLGAVYGGRLAAAVLEPGREPRFEVVETG